jgi:hypothetical protein
MGSLVINRLGQGRQNTAGQRIALWVVKFNGGYALGAGNLHAAF